MSSILKVDTIQTTAGAAPTTKDLGFAGGSVIQVVQGTSTSYLVAGSSDTYIDTGLTATITPKFASSKVLVLHSSAIVKNSTYDFILRLLRGSTNIHQLNFYSTTTTYYSMSAAFQYPDSPSTTSATTYKTQVYKNYNDVLYNYNNEVTSVSTLTLMEIAQ